MEQTAQPDSSSLAGRVLHAQVHGLFSTYWSSTISASIFAWSLALFLSWFLNSNVPLIWGGLHISTRLVLPPSGLGWRKANPNQANYWAWRHTIEMLVFSVVWGILPFLLITPDEPRHLELTMFLTLVVIGLGGSGAPALVAWWPSVVAFVIPMAVGLFGAFFRHGGQIQLFLMGGIAIYTISTLYFAHRYHRLMVHAIRTRFEKEELTSKLEVQVLETERISREKTRFLASASHDLRQPLHAIALFGAVLHKELVGQPQHGHATRMMRAVDALANSLDTMLDVSRLDAGVVEKSLQPTKLNDVLRMIQAVYGARAEEKGLQLRIRASELMVHTDPQMLQRLLANLVDNAIKYTNRGGVLVVVRQRGSHGWLEVWDSGIGISQQHQKMVFEEFFQVDNPGRDRVRGLGMGLAIVQRLANMLGYALEVESRLHVGTRFRLTLPLVHAQRLENRAEWNTLTSSVFEPPIPVQTVVTTVKKALPQRVLLIDDEADIAAAVGALLASEGVWVQAVADEDGARQALQQAQAHKHPFDALISDYRLANGADGVDVSMRLKAEFAPDVPLLIITGETAPERLQRVRDLRLSVLFKPVTAPSLVQALQELVSTEGQISSA